MLLSHSTVAVKSVRELIALAKRHPQVERSVAAAARHPVEGAPEEHGGHKLTHVAYTGSPPAQTALRGLRRYIDRVAAAGHRFIRQAGCARRITRATRSR